MKITLIIALALLPYAFGFVMEKVGDKVTTPLESWLFKKAQHVFMVVYAIALAAMALTYLE